MSVMPTGEDEAARAFIGFCSERYSGLTGPNAVSHAVFRTFQDYFEVSSLERRFVPTDPWLLLHLSACCWIILTHDTSQVIDLDADDRPLISAVKALLRTFVRLARLGQLEEHKGKYSYNGTDLPDWLVPWAHSWCWTPGEA